jgi:DNA-binding transcriptional MocR family regulator
VNANRRIVVERIADNTFLPNTRTCTPTRLVGVIRSLTSMASPLTAAVATRWIQYGTADAIVAAIRSETAARQEIASALLPPGAFLASLEGFHLWLRIDLVDEQPALSSMVV